MSRSIAASISRWSVSSQQHARRNAMIAATQLAERRRQHREVAEYLDRTLGEDRTPGDGRLSGQCGSPDAVPTQRRSS